MPKIVIKTPCILVPDYEWRSRPRIENSFRMYDMLTHTSYYVGLYYNEETKCLCLPRGIDIWFVEKYLNSEAYVDQEHDKYERIPDVYIKYLPSNDAVSLLPAFLERLEHPSDEGFSDSPASDEVGLVMVKPNRVISLSVSSAVLRS